MSSITPIPNGRITDQLANSLLLQRLQSNQQALLTLQQQISTGRRVIAPSDDAPAAAQAIDLQRVLEQKTQIKTNLQTNQSFLTTTDSALSTVSNLLSEARGVAVSASGSTITDDQRETAAEQIDSILSQLVDTANQQFNGRYLFSGSSTGVQPFTTNGQFVEYQGNNTQLQSFSDIGLLFPTNATGDQVFGALSAPISSVDLNPTVTPDTPLADLNGGAGVSLGSIQVSDGTHTRVIDLSKASTLQDVKQLLEVQPSGGNLPPVLNVQITSNGLQVSLVGSGQLSISEVGQGTTARGLGILAPNNITSTVAGADLNPKLTLTTSLNDILGTRAKTIIGSAAANNAIDLEALQNGAAANGYTVQFTDDGTVIPGGETVSVSGTTITVDIKSGVSTAAQVVTALNSDPTVSALFHAQLDSDDSNGKGAIALSTTGTTAGGSGIQFDKTSGLQITSGGTTTNLDISSANTVEDLLNLISGSNTGLVAQINSAGTGIQIQSRLSGNDFSIGENGGSNATELGIRTFTTTTSLDSLNHGLGVHSLEQQSAGGNDFSIQLEDGTTLQFQLTNESTVGDVINLINSAPGNGGKLTAQLATNGNGIELVSHVTGSSPFQVQQENNSQAAQDLGLIPAGQSTSNPAVAGGGVETITGSDVNPGETDSVFNALERLRVALRANDQPGIDRAVSLIDSSSQQLDFNQAAVGADNKLSKRYRAAWIAIRQACNRRYRTISTSICRRLSPT